MQLVFQLVVFALATISVLSDDTSEVKEDVTNRELSPASVSSPTTDETHCVCKVNQLHFGYKMEKSHPRIGNKCPCQEAKKIIRKKWRAAVYSKKRKNSQEKKKSYCLKPGKAIWGGKRYFYCVQTWHRAKKCIPCIPVDLIPTPL